MEVNNRNKSDFMKKIKKQSNQKGMNLSLWKVNVIMFWFYKFLFFILKKIPNKTDNYKFGTDPTMEDQIRRTNNWIYKTHKSNLDCPSGPLAQWIEALSIYGSRWALSEDSGFNSYLVKAWCDRQQLWKAVITGIMVTRLSIPIRGRG